MIVSWFRNGQVHTIITELTVKQNQEDFLSSTKHHMEPIPLSDWMDGNFFLYIYIYKKKKKKKNKNNSNNNINNNNNNNNNNYNE